MHKLTSNLTCEVTVCSSTATLFNRKIFNFLEFGIKIKIKSFTIVTLLLIQVLPSCSYCVYECNSRVNVDKYINTQIVAHQTDLGYKLYFKFYIYFI